MKSVMAYGIKGWTIVLSCVWMLIAVSCQWDGFKRKQDVVAELGEYQLTISDVSQNLALEGASSEDSLRQVDDYVKGWASDLMMYQDAKAHIVNLSEVDSLVESYRRALITYEYELQLVKENVSDNVTAEQMSLYYMEHSNLFHLDDVLLKAVFLVVPTNSTDFEAMTLLMESPSVENDDLLESLSVKNNARYETFRDRWVSLSEIQKQCPVSINKQDLLKRPQYSVGDSLYTALFYVLDSRKEGELQPYEYAEPRIKSILVEQKKKNFLQEYKARLYEERRESVKRVK